MHVLKIMQAGKKIKMLRALKGLTQDELAAKINKTRALVSHIEQTGKVNHHTLVAILKVLGINPDEFEKFDTKESLKPYKNAENNTADVLKEKIEHYQKEIQSLKEVIKAQKKTISVLESKK